MTAPLVLIVWPRGPVGVYVGTIGRLRLPATRCPFLDACRALIEAGVDPGRTLVMRHKGSDADRLTGQIGKGAKLWVREGRRGADFASYSPFASRQGKGVRARKARGA
jgi:hypothetical protein